MPNMLTIASYKALVPSACDEDASVLQPMINAANTAAEKYCNRTFDLAQSFTKYYDLPPPGGRNEIALNQRPVNSITSVNIDGRGGYGQLDDTFDSTTLLESGVDYYYEPGTDILRVLTWKANWPSFGMFAFGGGGCYGYPFGSNARNAVTGCVKVIFNAGYSEWPADLVSAVAGIASWMLAGGIESAGRNVTSYIDVSIGSAAALDALGYGAVPALGTARATLNTYKETAVPSQGRW